MADEPGTQTTTPPSGTTAPSSTAPKLPEAIVQEGDQFYFVGKSDGRDVKIPISEAVIRLQKDITADRRLEEAAARAKELEAQAAAHKNALAYWEASKKAMFQNDEDAGRQALQLIGFTGDLDVDDDEGGSPNGAPTSTPAPRDPRADKFFKAAEELGVDPEEVLRDFRTQEAEKIRNRVYGELELATKTDKDLGSILSQETPASKRVRERLRSLVGQKIGSEQLPANAATYARVIQEVKQELQDFGLLGQETAGSQPPSPVFPGMGPSAGGMGIVNNLRPKERPKPVRASEVGREAYMKNLQERWAFDMFQRS